jgi:phospholipid/cholesterol/gamma-HCH transport system permease protein
MGVLSETGRQVRTTSEGAGFTVQILLRTLALTASVPRKLRPILDQMFVTGVRTVPVVLLVAVFAGMILALQTGIEFRRIGGLENLIGSVVAVSMCREMGPFMTGIILAATVGSAMAAELGTMTVSEEVDALEVMSVDPVRYLVLPRVVALSVMCPLLTFLTDGVGILGGAIVAQTHLGVSTSLYFNSVRDSLLAPDQPFPKDIYVGLFKAFVFGVTIALVGCSNGLRAEGGALGVGHAVQQAVKNSVLLIIVLGYIITWLFYFVLGS